MSDIFISYSASDRNRIEPIVQLLEEQGWSVWWDRAIPVGKTFDEVIEKALDASKCVIVIWSKNSITSKWVRAEASEGAERNALAPVLLDDVRVPLEFRRIQAAKLFNWKGSVSDSEVMKLLCSIAEILGDPPRQFPQVRRPVEALPSSPQNTESSPALTSPYTRAGFKPSNLPTLPQQEFNQQRMKPPSSLTAKRPQRLNRLLFWLMLGFIAILVLTVSTFVIFRIFNNKNLNATNKNATNNNATTSETTNDSKTLDSLKLDIVGAPIIDPASAAIRIDLRASNIPEGIIPNVQQGLRVTIDDQDAVITFNSLGKDGFTYAARATLEDKVRALKEGKDSIIISTKSSFLYGTSETIIEKKLELRPLRDKNRAREARYVMKSQTTTKLPNK